MKFHFPDSDTGYYDREEAFYALDAEMEAAEERRYLEEIEASHGCEFDRKSTVPYMNDTLVYQAFAASNDIDPETGCTAAEMSEDRMPPFPAEHENCSSPQMDVTSREGKVA